MFSDCAIMRPTNTEQDRKKGSPAFTGACPVAMGKSGAKRQPRIFCQTHTGCKEKIRAETSWNEYPKHRGQGMTLRMNISRWCWVYTSSVPTLLVQRRCIGNICVARAAQERGRSFLSPLMHTNSSLYQLPGQEEQTMLN